MMDTTTIPMIYELGDALELDFTVIAKNKLRGERKVYLEVFEGYSPTVVTEVLDSIIDIPVGIVAVCMRIWGNLNIMCINDKKTNILSLYVYDRSKVFAKSTPWVSRWSREHAYRFLAPCIKGIYWRSVFENTWHKLDKGPTKLHLYNELCKKGAGASAAYITMWGDK